ncbi:MAG TPA: cation:proton antiporter [Chloroflexia bacterium]|jgi:CPA2 family monovalent cation:H+ antiporter-2
MENIDLLVDLAFAMGAALLGGFIAHLLRQPAILGYLLAGVAIGPYTPGPVTSVERVQTLANFGVALLMFALGTEFSMEALQRVRRVAVIGGLGQIALVILLGTGLGLLLGFSLTHSIFLGGVISICSSILMLKLLIPRGEVESIAGRVALGTSIVQDLATVALIIILPALAGEIGPGLLADAGLSVLRGGAFLAAAYLIGTRIVPPLLAWVTRMGVRELFLLTVVAIAVGMAVLGHLVGISFALGAFIGGLVVSESEFSSEVLDEIIPIRDIFSTLFFVSIGMLMEPAFLASHSLEITLLVATIIIGKFVISSVLVRLLGYDMENALRVGLLLAQIGEFSFVLAGVGLASGTIDEELYGLILAAALVTLVVNPILVNGSDRFIEPLGRVLDRLVRLLPGGSRDVSAPVEEAVRGQRADEARLEGLRRHVVLCGFGRVGREVARVLADRPFPFVVVEYNPRRVDEARDMGFLAIQGDATDPPTLERAGIAGAYILVVAVPDLVSAEQIVRQGRAMSERLYIIARSTDTRATPHLQRAGADQVLQPEFETGLEIIRQVWRKYGVSSIETQSMIGGQRRRQYSGEITEHDYTDDPFWS